MWDAYNQGLFFEGWTRYGTLEWVQTCPPLVHTFDERPLVHWKVPGEPLFFLVPLNLTGGDSQSMGGAQVPNGSGDGGESLTVYLGLILTLFLISNVWLVTFLSRVVLCLCTQNFIGIGLIFCFGLVEWWKQRRLTRELLRVRTPTPGPRGPSPEPGSVAAALTHFNYTKRVNIGPPQDGEQLYFDKNGQVCSEVVADLDT